MHRYSATHMEQKQPIRGPLAGLLASPCGVWVRIETDDRGAGWRRLLLAMTRRGVLSGTLPAAEGSK